MSKHAALNTFGRSGNPVIRSSAFDSRASSGSEKMTLDGTVNKTGISLLIVLFSASYTWVTPVMHSLALPATFLGFIFAMVNIFKPQMGHIFVPAYAAAQGVFLGTISMIFND